jgi:hypothetical protein
MLPTEQQLDGLRRIPARVGNRLVDRISHEWLGEDGVPGALLQFVALLPKSSLSHVRRKLQQRHG